MTSSFRMLMVSVSPWLMILFWFVVFAAFCFGTRYLVIRFADEERQDQLGHAGDKLEGAMAATFAFLVGFAITISWGGIDAGQSAVEMQAARSQQLSWALANMDDQDSVNRMLGELKSYLVTAVNDDPAVLAEGTGESLPSSAKLDAMEDSVHQYAYGMTSTGPEANTIVTSAQNLAMGQGTIIAVSQRALPNLLVILLAVAGCLTAVVMGFGAVRQKRPYLLLAWCFVSALAISVAYLLDYPFGGSIAVDFGPYMTVVDTLPG